jgi:hypothetical protein
MSKARYWECKNAYTSLSCPVSRSRLLKIKGRDYKRVLGRNHLTACYELKFGRLSKIDSEKIYLFAAGFYFVWGWVGGGHWNLGPQNTDRAEPQMLYGRYGMYCSYENGVMELH